MRAHLDPEPAWPVRWTPTGAPLDASGGAGGTAPAASPGGALVVGVVGARGGCGATTCAALVAAHLGERTATVLVDLGRCGPGIDVALALERSDGVRWPDVHDVAGGIRAGDVVDALPRRGRVAVLSADHGRPVPPDPALVVDVLHDLRGACGALVLDLDRAALVAGDAPVAACDLVVLVAGRDLRSVAGARALVPHLLPGVRRSGLVVTGGRSAVGVGEVAHAVGVDLLGALALPRRVVRDAEQVGPVAPRRGRATVARVVAAALEAR